MKKEDLQHEITETQAALACVDREFAEAVQAIRSNGVATLNTVLDSHGQPITKRGVNPACKLLSAARTLQRQLGERLGELRAELRRIDRTEK